MKWHSGSPLLNYDLEMLSPGVKRLEITDLNRMMNMNKNVLQNKKIMRLLF